MKKFNLKNIMLKAWMLFRRKKDLTFAECLHRAWLSAKAEEINEKRVEDAKRVRALQRKQQRGAPGKH